MAGGKVQPASLLRATALATLPGLAAAPVAGLAIGLLLGAKIGLIAGVSSAALAVLAASLTGLVLRRRARAGQLSLPGVRHTALVLALAVQGLATIVVGVLLSLPFLTRLAWIFVVPVSLVAALTLTWPATSIGARLFCRAMGVPSDNSPV